MSNPDMARVAERHITHAARRPIFCAARLRLQACLAACAVLLLPLLAITQSPQPPKDKPVAVLGDQAFYESDYLPQVQSQVHKIRMQEYEVRRKALEAVINQKLLEKEAEKRGTTPEEFLKDVVDSHVEEPSMEEIEQRFAMQMFRGGGATKEDITHQLMQQRIQAARDEYFWSLREASGAKVYLLPPRLDVAYDPARLRGNKDAAITIIEFSDFHCPYCLQAYTTVKNLLKKYDGLVKFAYRDLPLQEIDSGRPGSAEASRCAGEQGKFWEYHDLLFENQDLFGGDPLMDHAQSLSLDLNQFKDCLESGKFTASVRADFQEGVRLGITGTPAFFINGVFINGARPQAEFEHIIDTELYLLDIR